jgi:hypothetical protein
MNQSELAEKCQYYKGEPKCPIKYDNAFKNWQDRYFGVAEPL